MPKIPKKQRIKKRASQVSTYAYDGSLIKTMNPVNRQARREALKLAKRVSNA